MKLSDALDLATDSLYVTLSAEPIVITPKDVSALEERVRVAMAGTGYIKPFQIKINLDDKSEFIDVHAKSGIDEEHIGIRFEDKDGNILVFIDSDGDGT